MQPRYLSKNELKAVEEFRQRVNQSCPVVDFKLFGSKARGDFTEDSDIDLLLILKKVSEDSKDQIYDLINEILFKYGIDLSVKIFFQKEYNYLNRIPSVFMQMIQNCKGEI